MFAVNPCLVSVCPSNLVDRFFASTVSGALAWSFSLIDHRKYQPRALQTNVSPATRQVPTTLPLVAQCADCSSVLL